MVEMLVVIAIIGILVTALVPSFGKAKLIAEAAKNTNYLKQIAIATNSFATDNGNRMPSPIYPGGMEVPSGKQPEDFFPEHYDLGDSGMWLDGVVFAYIYMQPDKNGNVTGYDVDENGSHLEGTIFINSQALKKNPTEEDFHKLSYAMNANLAYDRIYDQVNSSDPYLTEKTRSNLIFSPNAMLFIECDEENVIMFEDRELVIDTIENRWGEGGKIAIAYLDGHAERKSAKEIPEEDIDSDRESSRFWRAVDPGR